MSWLFSRALVAAYSEATSSDGARSALLNGSPTPQAFLPPDRMTAFSRPSRFGMTFSPLTEDLGEAVLTWCQEASRARTSASPAREQALTEPAAECGVTWRGSLARFDPVTSSWRTAQPSLLEDLGESSVTWPRSGMTAGGQCWELPTLEHRTSGTGSGSWLTPTVEDAGRMGSAADWEKYIKNGQTSGARLRNQVQALTTKWPTPRAGNPGSRPNGKGGKVLAEEVEIAAGLRQRGERMWPTPTVCGNYNRKGASASSGDGLATAVLKCATPTARDWRSGKASQATHDKNSRPLSEQIGGSLNPTWVEWLMGWPLGWTDLKPLATGRCPSALQQHGDC